jgi:hypothetical protein
MLAPYLVDALLAPLADRPSHQVAEIQFIAERDRCSLFAAALDQWTRQRAPEPEFAL